MKRRRRASRQWWRHRRLYGRSGSKSLGGSILFDDIENTVYARIGRRRKSASDRPARDGKRPASFASPFRSPAARPTTRQTGFCRQRTLAVPEERHQAGLLATSAVVLPYRRWRGRHPHADRRHRGRHRRSIISGGAGSNGVGLSAIVNVVDRDVAAISAPIRTTTTTAVGAVRDVGNTSISATPAVSGSTSSPRHRDRHNRAPVPLTEDDDPMDGISLPGLFGEAATAAPSGKSGYGIAGSAGIRS